jgi:hypothetical protein
LDRSLIETQHPSPSDFEKRRRENEMKSGISEINFLFSVAQSLARRAIGASRLSIESLMFGEKYFGKHVAGLQVRKEVVLS